MNSELPQTMAYNELTSVITWTVSDTKTYLRKEGFEEDVLTVLCDQHKVDGKCLLTLNESDFTVEPLLKLTLKDRKSLQILCRLLQRENQNLLIEVGIVENQTVTLYNSNTPYPKLESEYCESERISPPISEDGRPRYPPEKLKALLSFLYVVIVTWITAFVMVIVHDRVPDMKKYPPLPDIFLDNIPHIPWAFDMCEVSGTVLFTIWLAVLLFHKHR